ncbi:molybdopterin synthase sulfur carrier subunit [Belliella buryatensis]|uniref:Molybdopterin synthase sulfur carrier subunit n=1 Tax=Belliella buryatensis TaxID=1500549 RepID=A0A239ARQ1_9BACT|nr:MoaD/ThiS family protein [Belliella buryatensis]SNR97734.1 molybdopterin synthase sulfur carrier subunit [Belliella buryatensis]
MKLLAFGKIAEIIGKQEIEIENFPNTDILVGYLQQQYPALKDLKFSIAIDKKQVSGNVSITTDAEVALLPPFSGG